MSITEIFTHCSDSTVFNILGEKYANTSAFGWADDKTKEKRKQVDRCEFYTRKVLNEKYRVINCVLWYEGKHTCHFILLQIKYESQQLDHVWNFPVHKYTHTHTVTVINDMITFIGFFQFSHTTHLYIKHLMLNEFPREKNMKPERKCTLQKRKMVVEMNRPRINARIHIYTVWNGMKKKIVQ